MPNRIVLTGAASGIGAATAARLLEDGHEIIAVDRNEPQLPIASFVECDLGDRASIDDAVNAIDGPVHALLNVAGIPGTHPDDAVLRVNFLGLRHLVQLMLPRLEPEGAIVNVASLMGVNYAEHLAEISELLATPTFEAGVKWVEAHPRPGAEAYDFSKMCVIVLSMHLSHEAWKQGKRVNVVSPGAVQTPILADFRESMGPERVAWGERQTGRYALPEEIAPVIAFLASEDARWMNGANVIVDGGLFAGLSTGAIDLSTVPL